MLTRFLKAIWELSLQALSLCCLILAGCGTDSPLVDPDDEVLLEPREVVLFAGDRPVEVTATWKSKKDGGTFERWVSEYDSTTLNLQMAQGSSPSAISLGISKVPEEIADSHSKNSTADLELVTISAQIKRNGQIKSVPASLLVHIRVPKIRYSIIDVKRKQINPQETAIKAVFVAETTDIEEDFLFDLRFYPTGFTLCEPQAKCIPANWGEFPTITYKPPTPGRTGTFAFEQTVKVTQPQTIGDIECLYQVRAASATSSRTIKGPIGKILFK